MDRRTLIPLMMLASSVVLFVLAGVLAPPVRYVLVAVGVGDLGVAALFALGILR